MRLLAPAKLTLSLRITGVRDDGYHLLDAEMVSLDLADELEVVEGKVVEGKVVEGKVVEGKVVEGKVVDGELVGGGDGVTYIGAHAPGVTSGDDLVSAALRLAGRRARVVVDKRIPSGAGLGGGSSDAAAILRWAGRTDPAAAAALGADVPFCLIGGRARVRGIGELVEPLPFEERAYTLLVPPFGCSTPAVYRHWDELGGPEGEHGNDLEPAALGHEPRLAEYRQRLQDATGQRPRLAGSGSTWFVEGAFPGDGRIVARTVRAAG